MNKTCALPLAAVLIAGTLAAQDHWRDSAVIGWYGDGSADQFTLTTPEELAGLAVLVTEALSFDGKTVQLAANLDLAGREWSPIGGDHTSPFSGVFDGRGHTISGLTVNQPEKDNQGLFGYVMFGSVRNLSLAEVQVQGNWSVGALVGSLVFGDEVRNCTANGTVTGTEAVGGLVGYAIVGTLSHCLNQATVSGKASVGGIVGLQIQTQTQHVINLGSVNGGVPYYGGIGGIAGLLQGANSLDQCINYGSVVGYHSVGGIAGSAVHYEVSGTPHVSNSTNYGTVITIGDQYAASTGGIAGYNAGFLTNCSNHGGVSGINSVGGIAGTFPLGTVANCLSTGSVSGWNEVGGLVGTMVQVAHVTQLKYSYWNQTNQPEEAGAIYDDGGYLTIANCHSLGTVPCTLNDPVTVDDVATTSLAEALNRWAATSQTLPPTRAPWHHRTGAYPSILPMDHLSVAPPLLSDSAMTISIENLAFGEHYLLESCTELGSGWTPVETRQILTPALSATFVIPAPPESTRTFFRAALQD